MSFLLALSAGAALLLLAGERAAANEANETGVALFEACRSCHALQATDDRTDDKPAGPHLKDLIGRPVAADETFDYSPVLRAEGYAGEVWTREKLDEFLADPDAVFPGLWKRVPPMPDAAARKALADFIADPNSR